MLSQAVFGVPVAKLSRTIGTFLVMICHQVFSLQLRCPQLWKDKFQIVSLQSQSWDQTKYFQFFSKIFLASCDSKYFWHNEAQNIFVHSQCELHTPCLIILGFLFGIYFYGFWWEFLNTILLYCLYQNAELYFGRSCH